MKRTQHYHFYATTKAYSLARICSEIHSIVKLHSTQYYSLLAKAQVVHFKRSEVTIAQCRVFNAHESHIDYTRDSLRGYGQWQPRLESKSSCTASMPKACDLGRSHQGCDSESMMCRLVRLKDNGGWQHSICPAGQTTRRRNRRRSYIACRSPGRILDTFPLVRGAATPQEKRHVVPMQNGMPNPQPAWEKNSACGSFGWLVRPGKCALQSGTADLACVRRAKRWRLVPGYNSVHDPRDWNTPSLAEGQLGSAAGDWPDALTTHLAVHTFSVLSLDNAVCVCWSCKPACL
jgi:hypothetical protein